MEAFPRGYPWGEIQKREVTGADFQFPIVKSNASQSRVTLTCPPNRIIQHTPPNNFHYQYSQIQKWIIGNVDPSEVVAAALAAAEVVAAGEIRARITEINKNGSLVRLSWI